MGGGDSSGGAQVIQPPRQLGPLEPILNTHSTLMANGVGQFAPWGSGHRMVPNVLFGQVVAPGPNPTAFGNAFDYNASAANYFGPSALINGGSNAAPLFPNSQQQSAQSQQQQGNPMGGLAQLQAIAPGLFNMSAFQQPAQANAGGGQQQQSQPQQQQTQQQSPQQQAPQLNPQQLAMQQQWIQAIQSAGGSLPNFNPQTGAFM